LQGCCKDGIDDSKFVGRSVDGLAAVSTLFSQSKLIYFLTNDFLSKLLLDVGNSLIQNNREWSGSWESGMERIASHLAQQSQRGNFDKTELQ
jgi:hypothetical protein